MSSDLPNNGSASAYRLADDRRVAMNTRPLAFVGSDFRPIHYMGNKSRFLAAIEALVDEVARPNAAACDLFAGTAVVARRLSHTRPVVCSDIQAYSRVLADALTTPRVPSAAQVVRAVDLARQWLDGMLPLVQGLLDFEGRALTGASSNHAQLADLIESGSLAVAGRGPEELRSVKDAARMVVSPETATMTWYYGGVYFSYRQALELDALRYAIRKLDGTDNRPATVVAALMGAASDAVSTVGNHFAQPVQPRRADGTLKRTWVTSVTRSREYSVFDGFDQWLTRYAGLRATAHPCVAVQADFRDVLSGLDPDVGVIYADPPYTRDHYSRFYHVLETIALDDDPGVTAGQGTSEPSRGMYRVKRHQSPFSIRTQVRPAFQELFAHAKRLEVPIVLSYSPMSEGTKARPETRLMSIQELVSLAGDYFQDVRVVDVASSAHSRFNRTEISAAIKGSAEVLLAACN